MVITAAGFMFSTSFAVLGWVQLELLAVQFSAMSPAAARTKLVPLPALVFTVTGVLAAETFPAASRARTA